MATRYSPDDPREWLNRASSAFQLAKQRSPRVLLEDLCVELYGCAEKALKAECVAQTHAAPETRALSSLLDSLTAAGLDVSALRGHAETLAPFGPGAEYPTLADPVSEEQYEKALDAAHEVLEWARNAVHAIPAYA